jgi:hypothetical protein
MKERDLPIETEPGNPAVSINLGLISLIRLLARQTARAHLTVDVQTPREVALEPGTDGHPETLGNNHD